MNSSFYRRTRKGQKKLRCCSSAGTGAEGDRQRLQSANDEAAAPADRIARHGESYLRHAPQQGSECDLRFETRQRGSHAVMDSLPQGNVAVGVPRKIQRVGLGKLRGVM